MDYQRAKRFVEKKLARLDGNFGYHGSAHTLNEVLPAAERIAVNMEVSELELVILRTAALFHDLGYLERYEANEVIGAKMAEEALPTFGYTVADAERVGNLVRSTAMPQNPAGPLGMILCDADLDSLGRRDYIDWSWALFDEMNYHGHRFTEIGWLQGQLEFLRGHDYWTETQREWRNGVKDQNIGLVERLIHVREQ